MHTFLVYSLTEQHLIEQDQCVSSPLLIKNSLDDNKSFICYVEEPSFVSNLTSKEGPYNYSEMMVVLEGPAWKIST